MTNAENLFIFATGLLLIFLLFQGKKVNWEKLGFRPKLIFSGWWQLLLFNIVILFLIQLNFTYRFIDLPSWMLDKDPLLSLLAIGFLQEFVFRGLAISWLERFGKQKALWISVLIFVLLHLVAPYTWSTVGVIFAILTLIGGYVWGLHFQRFRNVYMLGISHFLLNLSFNYVLFAMI